MNILGHNLGHDSTSPLIKKGYVVAARKEERYIKIKQERTFPINSINDCLNGKGAIIFKRNKIL